MPAPLRTISRLPFALALPVAFGLMISVAAAQPAEPGKKATDPPAKADSKATEPPVAKLPDGTFLWLGTPIDGAGEQVTLTPQELDKLLEQIDQLKKQLAARRPTAPSGCAVRGKIVKRGEQSVAVLKLTYTFHTTQAQTAIALGGRRGFLVTAALDGKKLPVLEPTDDGFAVLVETAGDHTLSLELDAPVTARGAKAELGFEVGLPRSAITTLRFDPPGPDVKRVNLTTRTPDPAQPARPSDPRRTSLDIKQLAASSDQPAGHALGPVDSLEVTWDPPATAAPQPADQVQSAELDVAVIFTESVVETTAKIKLRGAAREWKLVAPANADLSVDRAAGAEIGPAQSVTITKPDDATKPVWKIEFPAGSPVTDWVITVVTRPSRPKPDDPKHAGPFTVGPFTTLDVLRQTGTVRVTAGPHTHFTFKHGPDLRRTEPTGPPEEDVTTAFFRLTTGPTGTTPVNAPMFTVEARPQRGAIRVTPTYRLTLTEAGWRVRAEVKVFPIRAEVEAVAIDVPADWLGLEASPELVEGVQQGEHREGFWAATAARAAGGLRVPVIVRLAGAHKQPFDLILTATVPAEPTDTTAAVLLPRFPPMTDKGIAVAERGTSVTATVPEGLEVRGETRDPNGEYASWGTPLTRVAEASGKGRAVRAVGGKAELGLSRVWLAWHPYRPELIAEVRADVTLRDRQLDVVQHITLRSPEGFPLPIRLRGSPSLAGLKAVPPLEPVAPGEWALTAAPEAKEVTVAVSYALPVPRVADESLPAEMPVGLLWPASATRTESTVRVWSGTTSGRVVATSSPGGASFRPNPPRNETPCRC